MTVVVWTSDVELPLGETVLNALPSAQQRRYALFLDGYDRGRAAGDDRWRATYQWWHVDAVGRMQIG